MTDARATIAVWVETRDTLAAVEDPLLVRAADDWLNVSRDAAGSTPRRTSRARQTLSVDHVKSIGTYA
jgi:hypothetical protein